MALQTVSLGAHFGMQNVYLVSPASRSNVEAMQILPILRSSPPMPETPAPPAPQAWKTDSYMVLLLHSVDLGEGVSGPKAKKSQKNLEKSLPGPGPKSPEKVSKKVRKVKKKSENGFLETFRTFFETFSGLLGAPGRETFRDLLETFWLWAPRLLLPGEHWWC